MRVFCKLFNHDWEFRRLSIGDGNIDEFYECRTCYLQEYIDEMPELHSIFLANIHHVYQFLRDLPYKIKIKFTKPEDIPF